MKVLQNDANPVPQIHRRNVIDINVVEKNLAIVKVIKTCKKLNQRALAGTRRPYYREFFASLYGERNVMDDFFTHVIGKRHISKLKPSMDVIR